MVRSKVNKVPVTLEQGGDPNFDWTPYEDGWNGTSLKVNKNIKLHNRFDRVYCHESYAQEMYDALCSHDQYEAISPKDNIKGTLHTVVDIRAISSHEVSIDTVGGMSAVIDLNKERQYLDTFGCKDVNKFTKAIDVSDSFKSALLESGVVAKVVGNGRISLWDGHLSKIEREFIDQIKNPDAKLTAYNAKVKEINGGGYLVDVLGVQCFLPGSLAAAGIIPANEFDKLIGKTLPVMIVNYLPNSGFIVSYKKYLNYILPHKIETELYIGKQIGVKVTGTSKNGVFVQFRDENKEWVFSGLIHRSVMSKDFENRFNRGEFRINDEFIAYVNNIIETENGQKRIVVSDTEPVVESTEKDSESND